MLESPSVARSPRRYLTVLILVVLLVLAGLATGGYALYRAVYSPSAFVADYLSLVAEGRATDALRVPGVSLSRDSLQDLRLDATPSDVLLRGEALAPLTDVEILEESADADGTFLVTTAYRAGSSSGTTEFRVVQDGWSGIVPRWRFATSPLAVIEVVVRGSNAMTVNGFTFDRRQVAPEGLESDPLTPVPLLVLTPGIYEVTVNTATSTSDGMSVLAARPLRVTGVDLQTEPTDEFIEVVQSRVEEFLTECATQEVLQPTGCPFGYEIRNQIIDLPQWSIARHPQVSLVPDGAHWRIPVISGVAHLTVDVRLIYDGSLVSLDEDVDFDLNGTVTMLPDGKASIKVGAPIE